MYRFLMNLVAVAIAGFAAWMLVENYREYFQPAKEFIASLPPAGERLSGDQERTLGAERDRAANWNTALSICCYGACMGLMLGIVGGMVRGSSTGVLFGAVLGIALGGLMGAVGGYTEYIVAARTESMESLNSTLKAVIVHSVAWLLAASGIAVSAAVASGQTRKFVDFALACFGVGVLAALCYAPMAAILFADENSEGAIPTGSWNRLVWFMFPAVLTGVAVSWVSSKNEPSHPDESKSSTLRNQKENAS